VGASRKLLTLTIIAALAASSLLMVESASASNGLLVPEFTVKVVPLEWDTQNPQAIELQIKNQPYTPYNNSKGYQVNLYYNIRSKPHNSTEWTEYNTIQYVRDKWVNSGSGYILQSDGSYTNKSWGGTPLDNSKTDYQVQAIEGFFQTYAPYMLIPMEYADFTTTGTTNWSPTHTITLNKVGATDTIDTSEPSTQPTTPTPTETPTAQKPTTYSPYIAPIAIVVVVIALGAIFFAYDQRKQK
jgi:hypothetical protein